MESMPEPQHRSTDDWAWIDSPNPDELILAVFVDTHRITIENKPNVEQLAFGATPYSLPTQFKNLDPAFGLQHLGHLGVSDWYFTGQSIGGPRTAFYFFKNKTAEELAIPFGITKDVGDHNWHPVVEDVWTEEDDSFPQSTNAVGANDLGVVIAPTVHIRDIVIPDTDEGSRIITSHYLSALQPKIPHHQTPQAMDMTVRVNGAEKPYGKVLHDDIWIPSTRSGTTKYMSRSQTSGAVGGVLEGQFFPATKPSGRKPFYLRDHATQTPHGVWHRIKIKIRPPKVQPIER